MSSKNSQNEPFYLSLEVVLQIHERQLKEFGGASGIRNSAGIESAVETPKATFDGEDLYPTLFLKAAVYAFHIAEAQAFVDGNKRTALDVALTFLAINGCEVAQEQMELYDAMIAISDRNLSKEGLAELFEKLTQACDLPT
jgi:death-on-curing protein